MNILEIIQGRRSIRAFKQDLLDEDTLRNLIIKAGIWAPSAGNNQILRYIVVTDKKILHKIELASPGLLGNPPALIIVCQDLNEAKIKNGLESSNFLAIADAAMAIQNIMLYAYSLGLGTCIIASFHSKAVQKIVDLPPSIIPIFLVSIGYPDHFPKKVPVRNREVVWFNEYK
ncbi:MAG: nitroreductase family protein [Candidatus Caldatribacteriota bacterium]